VTQCRITVIKGMQHILAPDGIYKIIMGVFMSSIIVILSC